MWSEVRINGGKFAVCDQCEGSEEEGTDITITHRVPTGQAESVCQAFKASGGEILCAPAPMFWGQGECLDRWCYCQ